MKLNTQFIAYAANMQQHIADGTELEVEARFVDMIPAEGPHCSILAAGTDRPSTVFAGVDTLHSGSTRLE